MEGATGLTMLSRDRYGNARSVTLTGWSAVLGMAALVVVLMYGAQYAYKRYKGIDDKDYTLVVKKAEHGGSSKAK